MNLPRKLETVLQDYQGHYSDCTDCALSRALFRHGYDIGIEADQYSTGPLGEIDRMSKELRFKFQGQYRMKNGCLFDAGIFRQVKNGELPPVTLVFHPNEYA